MNAIHEYIEKCLAECPAGAEELLLAALIKKMQPKFDKVEQFEVFDEAGLYLGHFVPSFDDAILEKEFPEAMAAIRQRDEGIREQMGMSLEEFSDWVRAENEKDKQQLAEEALRAEKSA